MSCAARSRRAPWPGGARRALIRRRDALLLALLGGCAPRVFLPDGGDGRGRVLLLRGLGNIFSTGMDELAAKLAASGYAAEVHNHTAWRDLAARVTTESQAGRLPRPLAAVGHSLGANAALHLAGAVGAAGIATDLVVTFDPVWVRTVPPGPRRVVNLVQGTDLIAQRLSPEAGFDGKIENVALATPQLNHFNIDNDAALHERVIAALRMAESDGRGT